MIILSVHSAYQQPGGEDEVYRQESELLEQHGHTVVRYHAHNRDVIGKSSLELVSKTIFNREAYKRVSSLIREAKPDVMHVHNTFPLLSPSVYYAASDARVPVVQTLHNYRLVCPSAILYRKDAICERCLESKTPWPAVQHGCYRGRPASAATAVMLTLHRALQTYKNKVTTYITLSEFARSKFIQGGIPASKLIVKPNFIHPDPGMGDGSGNACLFVGRLTREKGIRTLLDAWTKLDLPFDLEIAGDGELSPDVKAATERCAKIHWLGQLSKVDLYERMKKAKALIVPSTWQEPFGLVVTEAFATGLPVIASKVGALSSIVTHEQTGLHFEPANVSDLANQVNYLKDHPEILPSMRQTARLEFLKTYTAERNYALLMDVYRKTFERYGSGPDLPVEPLPDHIDEPQALVQIAV